MQNINYEERYGVTLLDDLHNYFPDILYNNERFNNVKDVLNYITGTTRERFDLFSSAQRNHSSPRTTTAIPVTDTSATSSRSYTANNNFTRPNTSLRYSIYGNTESYAPPTPTSTSTPPSVSQIRENPLIDPTISPLRRYREPNQTQNGLNTFMNLFQNFGDVFEAPIDIPIEIPLGNIFSADFIRELHTRPFPASAPMSDVIIFPTEEEINAATRQISPDENTTCPICQEMINASEIRREINHCGHTFHVQCIDSWFRRSVSCPICRYDIRTNASAPAPAPATAPSNT